MKNTKSTQKVCAVCKAKLSQEHQVIYPPPQLLTNGMSRAARLFTNLNACPGLCAEVARAAQAIEGILENYEITAGSEAQEALAVLGIVNWSKVAYEHK